MPPKYSFVLPAYKATFFREAIESILNQTYRDFELIIVNDASPEDLTSIVNSYQDDRIQYYINEKNIGGTDLVAQWNHCITYAKGEYLILASDDDVYHLDYLEKMDFLINKYPNVNVFRPRIEGINANGEVSEESEILDEYTSYVDFLFLRYKGKVSSAIAYYIFNRDKLVNIGGFVNFPAAWISDDATVIRLSKNGVVSHNEVLFAFRTSGLNISSALNNSRMLSYKMLATEYYFHWFKHELKEIETINGAEKDKISLISSSLNRKTLIVSMIWLITNSDKEAVLSSWSILRNIKSLNVFDRIIICYRAISDVLKYKKLK